jgi:hypothetical protein
MSLRETGNFTEECVRGKLESHGLEVRKPVPDRGVDLETWLPSDPSRIARIQVKGRNPRKIATYRWFQLRVSAAQLAAARDAGKLPEAAWQDKIGKADFLILHSVNADETWIFPHHLALELIRLNERKYGKRPDNIFTFDEPLKGKQKEINLDIMVDHMTLTERFKDCLENFDPILEFLSHKKIKNPVNDNFHP